MYCVTLAYPQKEDSQFDFDYYINKHVPMSAGHFGDNVTKFELCKGLAAGDGSDAPYICIATLWINSVEEFKRTMSEHGDEIIGDIPNFTDVEPVIQINEVLNK